MTLDDEQARRRFGRARIARLATVGDGQPHIVPVAFFISGDTVYAAVDQKPDKPEDERRLRNVGANPLVSLLADEYEDDWLALWWVRADGSARLLEDDAGYRRALDLLSEKYEQYRERTPDGPIIEVTVKRWSGWSYAS